MNVLNATELYIKNGEFYVMHVLTEQQIKYVKHLAHVPPLPLPVSLDWKETSGSLERFVPTTPSQMVIPIKKPIQEKGQ